MERKPLLLPIVVNGVTIAPERIADEAQNHPAPKGKPGLAWTAAARALALRELMLQTARARGLRPDPVEVAPGQWETDDEALIRQLLDMEVRPAPVDVAALQAIYDAAPGRFRSPTLYEAAHILIPLPAVAADRAAAQERAGQVLAAALADPRRFGDLAREHSACPSRDSGGRLGQVTAGDIVPEMVAALAAMPVGSIAPDLVASRYGWHILRLDARAAGQVLPFAAVQPQLHAAQEKAAWVVAGRAFAERLAAGAVVTGVSLSAATAA